jgi:hypothetical protein
MKEASDWTKQQQEKDLVEILIPASEFTHFHTYFLIVVQLCRCGDRLGDACSSLVYMCHSVSGSVGLVLLYCGV